MTAREVVELPEGVVLQDVLDHEDGAVGWLRDNRPEVLTRLAAAGDRLELLFVPAGSVTPAGNGLLDVGLAPWRADGYDPHEG
jgi:hypothetical protein